jgi:oxygen-independent coproporphyrinogen-3 oxidase
MKGKSLYIHVPFCRKKCPYCHFFVIGYKADKMDAFTDLLIKEILSKDFEKPMRSIYFGGGTPYLLGAKNIKRILEITGDAAEVTLEANPEDVTYKTMTEYHAAGINRVSIGVQSFDDDLLKLLGRNHSGEKAAQAVKNTYKAGIKNITIDLMYDVPTQTREVFKESLDQCKLLPITHLSLYNLTIEPYTPFHKKQKSLEILRPTSEDSTLMLQDAVETLKEIGLDRYEISAFSKEGKESTHNTGYWKGTPFHGVGPSAFSYIDGARFQNVCNMKIYAERVNAGENPKDFHEKLDPKAAQRELLMTGIRMLKGIDKKHFKETLIEKKDTIQKLIHDGYLTETEERLALSEKGLLFYDDVAMELI